MLTLEKLNVLRGPNLWSRVPVMQARVSFDAASKASQADPAQALALEQAFCSRLPAMASMLPPLETSAQNARSLPELLAVAALALQTQAGCPVSFARSAPSDGGEAMIIVEYAEEAVGKLALEQMQQLYASIESGAEFDATAAVAALHELYEDIRFGPSTGSIVHAALKQGIPIRRMTEGSMVQLGWGRRQQRIQAAETSRTSAIGESIAQDKDLTKHLLASVGLPVPPGEVVRSLDDALAAAQRIGYPVVVKPQDGNQGKGVSVNLQTPEAVAAAFASAREYGRKILVEKSLRGFDFRLLVVGHELVAAARRDPPHVIGDGTQTIAALVEHVNKDPLRGDGHATPLTKLRLDTIGIATLAEQGLTPESVPAAGLRVNLRRNANLSTGGTATDVTDEVHPEVAAVAVSAARMVGLDICGVDVVAESVDRPLSETGGGMVELNAAPGLRMHLAPSYGKPRPIGEAIVRQLFEPSDDGRIPVVSVTGVNGKTTTVRLITHMMRIAGHTVGMTTTEGVWVMSPLTASGGVPRELHGKPLVRQIDSGDCSGPRSAQSVLWHPQVSAAVLETARGGMLREGLAFDRCAVGVVTNIGTGDHLGMANIHTAEDLAAVKRIVIQNVAPHGLGVLNAADPLVLAMAPFCPGRTAYFAATPESQATALRLFAQGHTVVLLEGEEIVLRTTEAQMRLPLREVPFVWLEGVPLMFQVENLMAALLAGHGLGLSFDQLARAACTFENDAGNNPGRFNRFTIRGATVIADYGHNADAMQALVQAVADARRKARAAGAKTRCHLVISAAGDRRDEDIRVQTRLLAPHFDRVVLFEDACMRGRETGETLTLLSEGLAQAGFVGETTQVFGEFLAIDEAIAGLAKDDLCLVLVDQVEAALAHLAKLATA